MMRSFTLGVLMEDPKKQHHTHMETSQEEEEEEEPSPPSPPIIASARVAERLARKKSERFTYLVAAVMSSFGITSMAVLSVYSRFSWQMEVITKWFLLWFQS